MFKKCFLVTISSLALMACADRIIQEEADTVRPVVVNAVDSTALAPNPRFRFLPPLVKAASSSARLDMSISQKAELEVCEITATSCNRIARFTIADAFNRLNVDSARFSALWQTDLNAGSRSYLARVLVNGNELGRIAIDVVRDRAHLDDVSSSSAARVVAGTAVPINFRIEEGALWEIPPDGRSATNDDGKVKISFPAGALSSAVALTIVPVSNTNIVSKSEVVPGTVYSFGPHGITFAKPVVVTIKYDKALVPAGMSPNALRLKTQVGNAWIPVAKSSVDTASGTVTGELMSFSNKGIGTTSLTQAIQQVEAALVLFTAESDPSKAAAFKASVQGLAEFIDEPDFDAEIYKFYTVAGAYTCGKLVGVKREADTSTQFTLSKAFTLISGLLGWSKVTEIVDADCKDGNAPFSLGDVVTLIDKMTRGVATDMSDRIAALKQQPATFNSIVSAYDSLYLLAQQAKDLELTDAYTTLANSALKPLGDKLRTSGYQTCLASGNQFNLGLMRLYARKNATAYSDDALRKDIQQCGTTIAWKVIDKTGAVIASGKLGGGAQPGSATEGATAPGLSDGKLILEGPVFELSCSDGHDRPDDRLTVAATATVDETQRQSIGKFYTTPKEISFKSIIAAAKIDPNETNDVPLEIIRNSSGCSGLYSVGNNANYTLGRITLKFPPVSITVLPNNSVVKAGAAQGFIAQVKGSKQGVTWSASKGSIDSTGNYQAMDPNTTIAITATSKEYPDIKGTATVQIPDVRVALNKDSVQLSPGATQQFGATITGTDDGRLTWLLSDSTQAHARMMPLAGGTITPSGLYTAPTTPGTYYVSASSTLIPSRFAKAKIVVVSKPTFELSVGSCALGARASVAALSNDVSKRDSEADPLCGSKTSYSRTVSIGAGTSDGYASANSSSSATLAFSANDSTITVSASGGASASASSTNPDTSYANRGNSDSAGEGSTSADLALVLFASGGRGLVVEITGSASAHCENPAFFTVGRGATFTPGGLIYNAPQGCDGSTWTVTFSIPAGQRSFIMHSLHVSAGIYASSYYRSRSTSSNGNLSYVIRIKSE